MSINWDFPLVRKQRDNELCQSRFARAKTGEVRTGEPKQAGENSSGSQSREEELDKAKPGNRGRRWRRAEGGGRMRGCAESGCLNVRDAWCVDAVVDACSVDSARMETRLAARLPHVCINTRRRPRCFDTSRQLCACTRLVLFLSALKLLTRDA